MARPSIASIEPPAAPSRGAAHTPRAGRLETRASPQSRNRCRRKSGAGRAEALPRWRGVRAPLCGKAEEHAHTQHVHVHARMCMRAHARAARGARTRAACARRGVFRRSVFRRSVSRRGVFRRSVSRRSVSRRSVFRRQQCIPQATAHSAGNRFETGAARSSSDRLGERGEGLSCPSRPIWRAQGKQAESLSW